MSQSIKKPSSNKNITNLYKDALSLFNANSYSAAISKLTDILEINPNHQPSLILLIRGFIEIEELDKAKPYLPKVQINSESTLNLVIQIYNKTHSYDEAENLLENVIKNNTLKSLALLFLANIRSYKGDLKGNLELLKKAHEAGSKNPYILGKRIIDEHFNHALDLNQIRTLQQQWQKLYTKPASHSTQTRQTKRKTLRIGLLSDGFNNHPVARMTMGGLHTLPKKEFQLYAYSSGKTDIITEQFKKKCDVWRDIKKLSDIELYNRIQKDHIDILIDLNGYHNGSRLVMLSSRPSPLLVKWVGGLNDSMGLDYIDYLISDKLESPIGTDNEYTEKLIRMPNGYISYTPPTYTPDLSSPPVFENGYITFGCFNNANKLNEVTNATWAKILHRTPHSRLLLKGSLYEGEDFKAAILNSFSNFGIAKERIIFEGQSKHRALLETYNKIDICLDPWPFSGGLTTLESLLMGVPVITHPGPTFASRHSTSHVSNAGYPDLVAASWDEYIEIACSLAENPLLLKNLRSEMRDVFLKAPICDHNKFSTALRQALLGIWHRHCENKKPAAVQVFDNETIQFEDESELRSIPPLIDNKLNNKIEFNLDSPALIIDHGAELIKDKKSSKLYTSDAAHIVCFDPANLTNQINLPIDRNNLQLVSQALLGDGEPSKFYAQLDNEKSGTLKPLDTELDPIATFTLPSVRLDDLPRDQEVDWLVLSNNYDNNKIINNSSTTLSEALIVSVIIDFDSPDSQYLSFDRCRKKMEAAGLQFHTFLQFNFKNLFKDKELKEKYRGSQVSSAMALFVHKNTKNLPKNRVEKMAFLLHNYFEIPDFVFNLLEQSQHPLTERYSDYIKSLYKEPIVIPNKPAMSEAEIDLLEHYLSTADNYYEFGSGGSTKLAASMGLTVYGVESDKNWLEQLKLDIGEPCQTQYVDIGKTGAWGYPEDLSQSENFPNYSKSIHQLTIPFDLILVDGRFRVACVLESILYILEKSDSKNTKIFIHDFWNRDHYMPVLNYLDKIDEVETAGVFKLKSNIDLENIHKTIKLFSEDYR